MKCRTCDGVGTVEIGASADIQPRHLDGLAEDEIIIECPACHGTGDEPAVRPAVPDAPAAPSRLAGVRTAQPASRTSPPGGGTA